MFEQVTTLLFDLDGTLINTDDVYVNRLAEIIDPVFGQRSHKIARKVWMTAETPGNFAIEIMDKLHIDDVIRPVKRALVKISGRHRKEPEQYLPVAKLAETLETLSKSYKIGMVTTRDAATIQAFLEAFPEIAPYFEVTVGGDDCLRMKPHPAPVRMAAKKLGVSPENCIMIGDTSVDIRAGKAAGAKTIGVLTGFGRRYELASLGADLVLPSIAAIPEAIASSQIITKIE